ncbi:MAG: hypothetical protein LBT06_03530, partial [Hungatella sp.]|nr:hypothetical protein [Hungatella sp.]
MAAFSGMVNFDTVANAAWFCIAMGAIVLILAITLGLGFGVWNLSDSVKENFPALLHFIFAVPVASVCIVSVLVSHIGIRVFQMLDKNG